MFICDRNNRQGGDGRDLVTLVEGREKITEKMTEKMTVIVILLRSQLNAKLFFRFHKLPLKITEISHFFEEKIEKVGV